LQLVDRGRILIGSEALAAVLQAGGPYAGRPEELSLRAMLVSWMLDGLNSLLHDRFFCPCLSPHYSGAKGTATARRRRSVGLLMRLWRLAERVARLARFVGGGVVLLYMLMLNAAEVI
jgi:hypothetical protein